MSTEETLTLLGACNGITFQIKGMAVIGNEYQILCSDVLGVVKGVMFVHDDLSIDYVNPPTEPFKTKYEEYVKFQLKEREAELENE